MEEEKKTAKSEAALREEKILEFWKENNIFKKTVEARTGSPEFVFYEGPPTANGNPGIHHLESRAFKDAIPRYKTMQGYHVRRKGGWDTHGLPVELQVEKKLGLTSKKAIEEYGIAKFNQDCKHSVWEYLETWNKFTKRIGYWVDQENAYVTYHNDYIESVWNIVKKVNEQGLLYKDYKVVPWCPRCGTALSSHELAQGYEDVKDLSVTVKFKVKGEENTYILAWTTTPWTLPGNVALAVGADIDYVKILSGGEFYFLAKARLSIVTEPYEIVEEIKGAGLVGMEYEPVFPYLTETISEKEKPKLAKAYRVHKAGFVTTDDGTGVVHTAVMYGQDDFVLGGEVGLPKHHLVGLDGKFLPGTGIFEGRFVKDEEVAVDIIKDLAHRGLLFKKEKYEHSYPHCWRCKTPLIYYARDSWYIKMSDPRIKSELISENKKINWEPSHLREGRFGEWLREIKDWAVSRERYWGTPLPVWHCEACGKTEVLGSVEDLKSRAKKSGNRYFMARHGEARSNVGEWVNSSAERANDMTLEGIHQVEESAEARKNTKFDMIFASPMPRTRATAEIIADTIGFDKSQIVFDDRLWEIKAGEFDGKPVKDFHDYWLGMKDKFTDAYPGGESRKDMYARVSAFLYELEEKYKDKTILIVSHGDPVMALCLSAEGFSRVGLDEKEEAFDYFKTGEIREISFTPLPHNENFELDLHRPYIDEVALFCSCAGKLERTKEVMDVWFDSGAMPFAEDHYPFENKAWVEGAGYPADYISEAIDQTRGWFYTLHAVGILMGRGLAYKNVICLGHLLDAKGKKMSKSLGNIVDPWQAMDKYGVDTLRLWMYSVNQPGESKNFDEKTVALLSQQVFGLLYNVLAFYELYRDKDLESGDRPASDHILDKWILARLDELVEMSTENLDNYKLLEPVRAIREFIGDLSTWYLRRSRERIKEGDRDAKATLYYVLRTLSKLLAPFAPLAGEDVWQKLKNEDDQESVHLEPWPTTGTSLLSKVLHLGDSGKNVIANMESVRNLVTLGLEARQKTGIKVRQPLRSFKVKGSPLPPQYVELIKEELNVKEILFDKDLNTDVFLDVRIDESLKAEGDYREFVRALQDMRKKMGLTPNESVGLVVSTDEKGKELIETFRKDMEKTVMLSDIKFAETDGETIRLDELTFKVSLEK